MLRSDECVLIAHATYRAWTNVENTLTRLSRLVFVS